MTGPLLFLAADPRECHPFLKHWDRTEPANLPVHWARRGTWKSRPVLAIANGAGPERARMAVQAAGPVRAVCNIGFCGALDISLGIGDVFMATSVNGTATSLPRKAPPAKSGPLASIPRIAQTAANQCNGLIGFDLGWCAGWSHQYNRLTRCQLRTQVRRSAHFQRDC